MVNEPEQIFPRAVTQGIIIKNNPRTNTPTQKHMHKHTQEPLIQETLNRPLSQYIIIFLVRRSIEIAIWIRMAISIGLIEAGLKRLLYECFDNPSNIDRAD